MTIADHIREEVTFNAIKGLLEKNFDDQFIADVVKLPIKKVQEIIQKIKDSNQ